MKSAYVYYRVDPAQATLAAERIDALLGALGGHCRQPPRRLVHCDDPTTWMEIYEGIADFAAFAATLDAGIQTFDCAAFTQGERHLECFSLAGPSHRRSA